MVDCGRFEELLFAGLDSELTPADAAWMEEHSSLCGECSALGRVIAGSAKDLGNEADQRSSSPGLVDAILLRTSGDTCGAARARLAEGLVVRPEPYEGVLAAHLANCPECAAMARAMRAMAVELPALRELDPGPRFTSAVVAATARGRLRGWPRLLQRPRLAWEGAYIGTLALWLLAALAGSPLSGLPGRALAEARVESSQLQDTVERGAEFLVARGLDSWAVTTAEVRAKFRSVTVAGSARARGLAGAFGPLSGVTAAARVRGTALIAAVTAVYRHRFQPVLDRIRVGWGSPEIPEKLRPDNEQLQRQLDDERDDNAL